MTLNEVLWRQVCTIKAKVHDLLISAAQLTDVQDIQTEIATQAAIVVCYAAYATGDVSPIHVYEDILQQVSQLQNIVWSFYKACNDTTIATVAHKLYESCATLKKRVRKRLRAIESDSNKLAIQAKETVINAFDAPSISMRVTYA